MRTMRTMGTIGTVHMALTIQAAALPATIITW
jgi:hypothetical protein